MYEQATGLILRVYPLTETSLIIHWLSPELGRIATVAKGARQMKSPFRGKLDLYHLADFVMVRSHKSSLHTLSEVVLKETFPGLRAEYRYLQQLAYMARLIEDNVEIEISEPGLFELFQEFLNLLPLVGPSAVNVIAFEACFLDQMGQMPPLDTSKLDAGCVKLLSIMMESDRGMLSRLAMSADQSRTLARYLEQCLMGAFGRLSKGRYEALSG
jgi:DNA repair protein RecO (recombination protein O)